jgi:hypothetical protein
MLIHHIKTSELHQLARMFHQGAGAGAATPQWLLQLMQTAPDIDKPEDFQDTRPANAYSASAPRLSTC